MTRVPETLTLRSPSKINLHLRVAGPDASGFHPLRSWMITTSLDDELTFTISDRSSLTCDDPNLPCDASNLVTRAQAALLAATDAPPISVHLIKRIPAGAGLGGGSGNAAATLVGLNRLLRLGRTEDELRAIAATLGSDVPFFLGPPSAIATGRGETIKPCPSPRLARIALLIIPPFPISTAAAYRALDQLRPVPEVGTIDAFDSAAWAALPAMRLLPQLANDLEVAAFSIEPRLADLRGAIESQLGRIIRMSGSGSTLFTLFDRMLEAESAARTLTKSGIRTIVVELGSPSGFSA